MRYEEKISVIVPVYNTKQYICDCVKSVLKQTYRDFEVILVDDGSWDGSENICERLCTVDKRIRLIHQKHSGVSAARNTGIKAAKGKYLFFLDSDDMIHPQLLEALYKLQEENHTVIAATGLYYAGKGNFRKSGTWKIETDYMEASYYLNRDEAEKCVLRWNERARLDAIGGKMILRESVKKIQFHEEITKGEDTLFLAQLILNGADVTVLLRDWYYYRKNREDDAKVYSVEKCKGRYKIQKFIRNYEIRKGRISEAAYVEWCLLCEMVSWYESGKKSHDIKLERYVKQLMLRERKQKIFSKVDWCRKAVFYIGCVYYPLYKMIEDIMRWYHTKIEPVIFVERI